MQEVKTYLIPENYIAEGTILNGKFKKRNAFEAIFVAIIAALIASTLVKGAGIIARITTPLCAGIFFAFFAYLGIDGEPLSKGLLSFFTYFRNRNMYVYQKLDTALSETPFEQMLEDERASAIEKVFAKYQEGKKKSEITYADLVEGENYTHEGKYLKDLRYKTMPSNKQEVLNVFFIDSIKEFNFSYGSKN